MPAALTETDRTPAPDSSSRHPPDSFVVTFTASPFTAICVVRRHATVRYVGGASPSPILSRQSLPFSIAIAYPPQNLVIRNRKAGSGVGREGVSTCKIRWSAYHYKK